MLCCGSAVELLTVSPTELVVAWWLICKTTCRLQYMFSVHVDGDLFISLALEAMLVAEACAVACARNGGVLHKPPGFPCP